MSKIVLDIGQCNPDHSNISNMLAQNFDVTIERAHSHEQAIALAMAQKPALVLINRLYDADGRAGMDTLKVLKANDSTAHISVMIVSNYAETQETAIAAGAVAGFGKSTLHSVETINLLKIHLTP